MFAGPFPYTHNTVGDNVSIQLPPYPYAVQLVSQFEAFMAWEYHWYRRQDFHTTLEATYRSPDSPRARNRIWLCKVMAVLALGESYNSYEPPLINLSQSAEASTLSVEKNVTRNPYLPGVRFFEQALSLFKMPSEEPEIEHVEALNLIVSSAHEADFVVVVSHMCVSGILLLFFESTEDGIYVCGHVC